MSKQGPQKENFPHPQKPGGIGLSIVWESLWVYESAHRGLYFENTTATKHLLLGRYFVVSTIRYSNLTQKLQLCTSE